MKLLNIEYDCQTEMAKLTESMDFWTESFTPGLRTGHWIGQFELGGSAKNLIYLITDPESGAAFCVDTQKEMKIVFQAIKENGLTLGGVLLTHTHWDHVAGLPEIAQSFPGIPLYVHPKELHRIEKEKYLTSFKIQSLKEGMRIPLGNLSIETLHLPGHSAGGSAFFLPSPHPTLFTGDTLFLGDCGRTDLPTGNDEEMWESLQRIKTLPPETWILPGHHYIRETSGVLSRELSGNKALRCKSLADLRALP